MTDLAHARNRPMPDLPALLFSLIGLFLVALFFQGRVGLLAVHRLPISRRCYDDSWRAWPLVLSSFSSAAGSADGKALDGSPLWRWRVFPPHFSSTPFCSGTTRLITMPVVAFYCVVQDVTRFWTPGCEEKFYREAVGAERVIRDYLGFALSLPGVQFFLSSFGANTSRSRFSVARSLRGCSNADCTRGSSIFPPSRIGCRFA